MSVNYSSRLHVLATYIGMTESECTEAMWKFIEGHYDSIEKNYFAANPPPTGKKHRHPKNENIRDKVMHWWEDGTKPQGIGHYAVLEFFKAQCSTRNLAFDPEWFDLPLHPDLRKIPELAKAINQTFGYYSAFDNYRLYALEAGNGLADEKSHQGYFKLWRIRSDNTLVHDVLYVHGSEHGALCCTLYRYFPKGRPTVFDQEKEGKPIKIFTGNIFVYGDHFYAVLSHKQDSFSKPPEPLFLLYPRHVGSYGPSIGIHSCIVEGGMPLSRTFLIYQLDEDEQTDIDINACVKKVENDHPFAERYRRMLKCEKNYGASFVKANPDSLNE